MYVCMYLMIGKGQIAQKRPYWGDHIVHHSLLRKGLDDHWDGLLLIDDDFYLYLSEGPIYEFVEKNIISHLSALRTIYLGVLQ